VSPRRYTPEEDAERRVARLEAALREIVECRSRFALDPLERATNAVEHCQSVARAALTTQEDQ